MSFKKVFLCIALLAAASAAMAEPSDKIKISGTVSDASTRQTLEYVTIVLVNEAQKVVATTTTNGSGKFLLDKIGSGNYTLKASFLGYAEKQVPIKIAEKQSDLQLAPIALSSESKTLDAVTVTVKKNMIEQDIDKTIFNVADMISTEGANATDVLRKIAGLVVDNNGNVTFNGQAVAVWVDGRPSNLSGQDLLDLLYFLDASNIDKIEVIQNPSAKYDAAGGGGIINIIMKNSTLKGFSGSVQAGGGYYLEPGDAYNVNGGLTLNYRNTWINTVVSAGARDSRAIGISENTLDSGAMHQYSYNKNNYTSFGQSLRVNNSFVIDKKNIAGLVFAGNWNSSDAAAGDNSRTENYWNGVLLQYMINGGASNGKMSNYAVNANYQHIFKENSQDLLFNFDYMNYTGEPQTQQETYFYEASGAKIPDSDRINKTFSSQQVQVASARADYVRPLWRKWQLEAGGKFSQTLTNSDLLREDLRGNTWVRNDRLSYDYRYDERIGALYTSVGAQFGEKWSAKAGLRWEHTWNEGSWHSDKGDSTISQNYNNLFPSLYVSFKPVMEHSFALSYVMRIQRPSYSYLNPFRNYINESQYTEGNPNLQPQYTHSFNFNYTYNRLTVGLVSQYSTQVIEQETKTDQSKDYPVTFSTWNNFGKTNFTGLSVLLTEVFPVLWWSFNASASALYAESKSPGYSRDGIYATAYLENTFYIGRTWRAEISGYARSPFPNGYYTMSGNYSVSAGVRKNLWNYRGTLSLYVDDIFDSQRNHTVSELNGGQRIEMNNTQSSRQIRLSFTYRFRNLNTNRQGSGNTEDGNRL